MKPKSSGLAGRLDSEYSDVLSEAQIQIYARAVRFQARGLCALLASLALMIVLNLATTLSIGLLTLIWAVLCGASLALAFTGIWYSWVFMRSVRASLGVNGSALYRAMVRGGRPQFDQRLASMRARQELKEARRKDAERLRATDHQERDS